jgi:hypothetical protein
LLAGRDFGGGPATGELSRGLHLARNGPLALARLRCRGYAIGRENWLFVGSDKEVQTAAVLFSLTSTCHDLGIEP